MLVIGLAIAIVQTATQLQESALTFVPKLAVTALVSLGAALVVPPPAAVAMAVLAAASYFVAIVVDLPPGGLDMAAIAIVGVNLLALILLAYVAMVVAREQRRTRRAAWNSCTASIA